MSFHLNQKLKIKHIVIVRYALGFMQRNIMRTIEKGMGLLEGEHQSEQERETQSLY